MIATGTPASGTERLARLPLLVDRAGLGEHRLRVEVDEHVEPLERPGAVELGLDDLFGGDGPRVQLGEQRGRGGTVHRSASCIRVRVQTGRSPGTRGRVAAVAVSRRERSLQDGRDQEAFLRSAWGRWPARFSRGRASPRTSSRKTLRTSTPWASGSTFVVSSCLKLRHVVDDRIELPREHLQLVGAEPQPGQERDLRHIVDRQRHGPSILHSERGGMPVPVSSAGRAAFCGSLAEAASLPDSRRRVQGSRSSRRGSRPLV